MDKPKRIRIDKFLVDHGYFASRERAQRSILAGHVLVEENVIDKPGTLVKSGAVVRVVAEEKYVGRGGYKLESLGQRASWECNWKSSMAGFSTRSPLLPSKRRQKPPQARIVVLFANSSRHARSKLSKRVYSTCLSHPTFGSIGTPR